MTIGTAISEVRNSLKAVNADYKIPNKYIWSIISKHVRWLLKREAGKFNILKSEFLFQTLKCVEVEEAPAIDDCCGVKSRCVVYRTELKLPKIYEDGNSVVIKDVFTIDGSTSFTPITVPQYMRKLENPNSKYDKGLYYYYNNGYLYLPNSRIRGIMVKAFFEEDITDLNDCSHEDRDPCRSRLDDLVPVPDYLLGELMQYVMKDIAPSRNIRDDGQIDKNETNIR